MGKFICAATPGNADVLEVRDRPTPNAEQGQIVIRQTKMGLNFLDVYQTSGLYPFPENDVFVPGNEGVGVVLAVGAGVTAFAEGDRVGYPMHVGAFAEERVRWRHCTERSFSRPPGHARRARRRRRPGASDRDLGRLRHARGRNVSHTLSLLLGAPEGSPFSVPCQQLPPLFLGRDLVCRKARVPGARPRDRLDDLTARQFGRRSQPQAHVVRRDGEVPRDLR